jgi:hypothetical protein
MYLKAILFISLAVEGNARVSIWLAFPDFVKHCQSFAHGLAANNIR